MRKWNNYNLQSVNPIKLIRKCEKEQLNSIPLDLVSLYFSWIVRSVLRMKHPRTLCFATSSAESRIFCTRPMWWCPWTFRASHCISSICCLRLLVYYYFLCWCCSLNNYILRTGLPRERWFRHKKENNRGWSNQSYLWLTAMVTVFARNLWTNRIFGLWMCSIGKLW